MIIQKIILPIVLILLTSLNACSEKIKQDDAPKKKDLEVSNIKVVTKKTKYGNIMIYWSFNLKNNTKNKLQYIATLNNQWESGKRDNISIHIAKIKPGYEISLNYESIRTPKQTWLGEDMAEVLVDQGELKDYLKKYNIKMKEEWK